MGLTKIPLQRLSINGRFHWTLAQLVFEQNGSGVSVLAVGQQIGSVRFCYDVDTVSIR